MGNFRQSKRLRELAKQQKREEKKARKLQRRVNPEGDIPPSGDPSAPPAGDTNPEEGTNPPGSSS